MEEQKYEIIKGCVSEETAYVVDDYPYGFRLRTKIRYWIETTKNGDRFVSQTLNPKTGFWNKPKKSTYDAVMVMRKDNSNGYINYFGLWKSAGLEELDKFMAKVGDYSFTSAQKSQINSIKAMGKALEGVEFSCHAVKYRNKKTGEVTTQVPMFNMSDYEKLPEEVEIEKKNRAVESYILSKANKEFKKLEGM